MNVSESKIFDSLIAQKCIIPNDFLGRSLQLWPKQPAYALLKAIEAYHISQFLDGDSQICDIGIGDGKFAKLLDLKINFGLDIDSNKVNHAKQLNVYDELIVCDITNDSSIQKNYYRKFDIVFSISVLEHITNIEHALMNISSLLSNQGKLILIIPTENKLTNLFYPNYLKNLGKKKAAIRYIENFSELYKHYSTPKIDWYYSNLKKIGFKHIDIAYFERKETSYCIDIFDRERFRIINMVTPNSPLFLPLKNLTLFLLYSFFEELYIKEQKKSQTLNNCSECIISASKC